MWLLTALVAAVSVVNCQDGTELFKLNVVHYNDFHARFEEISPGGGACEASSSPCIGGFARLVTAARRALSAAENSVLLNAGDSFQGTIWYNLLRWNVTQEFMNMLPHDAHVLGNHEFDNGIEGLVPYIEHLSAPMLAANIIADREPTMQGTYKPSIVVKRNGRKIGIIGVIIASTDELSSTGQLEFSDEIETVKSEAEKLNSQGIDIIIVLSHCGIEIDLELAKNGGPYIDIIVGGHSHTLLYTGSPPDTSAFAPNGPYPTVVDQGDRNVLIVQAAAHTVFLGEIQLLFDDRGNLVEWHGNPHYMANEIEPAPDVLAKLQNYKPIIDELAKREIGHSMVHLTSDCACEECNLGNLICDSMLYAVIDQAEAGHWNAAHFSIINQGSVRADITPGVITFEKAILAQPFENTVEVFQLRGEHVLEMLEFAAINEPFPGARTLQFAGLRVHFDGNRPVNERVVNATVRCIECEVPRYEPLETAKDYTVVAQSFLADGGDGFAMIPQNKKNVEVIGVDYEILLKYIEHQSPLFAENDKRMLIDSACMN